MTTAHTSNRNKKHLILTKTQTTLKRLRKIFQKWSKKNSKLTKIKVSFDYAKHIYQNDSNKSNFNYKLEYSPTTDNIKPKKKHKKKMNIL